MEFKITYELKGDRRKALVQASSTEAPAIISGHLGKPQIIASPVTGSKHHKIRRSREDCSGFWQETK